MKTTVVPAQITTVEDKVAGNLSFTQLLLLMVPVFLNGALFAAIPPIMKLSPLKMLIGLVLALLCMALAIRIKGKILLTWVSVIARYNLRPRLYVFNKNDTYLRPGHQALEQPSEPDDQQQAEESGNVPFALIPTPEMVRLESAVADPRSKFHFKATKGGLRVYIREVKEEGA